MMGLRSRSSRTGVAFLASALVAGAFLQSGGLRAQGGAAAAVSQSMPDGASLEVHPSEIVLQHRYASAQVLVQVSMPDGSTRDVTRAVDWQTQGAQVDERGLVQMPVAATPDDGGSMTATVTVRYADQEVAIPVRVEHATDFEPGFAEHVQPVLSAKGCNTGTCHGSAEGQNGFQLSLRGYDWIADHRALTDDLAGRRFDLAEPDNSLFLLKPLGAVPHEGGKLLDQNEPDYALVREWIEAGARREAEPAKVVGLELFPADPTLEKPGSEQQFAVRARYSDGSVRDVTAHAFLESANIEVVDVDGRGLVKALRRGEAAVLARYEGAYAATRLFVMGERDGFEWKPLGREPGEEVSYIDSLIEDRLQTVRALPSGDATDEEFLRRLYLDLTGLLPDVRDVEIFQMDQRPRHVKRADAVERLLGSTGFVEFWSNRWADLLQVHPKYLSREGADRLHAWIRRQVASNRPYDEFVRELIAAKGSTWENPPAAFHKIHREPDLAMEATTQLFLGVRFNCNKCHDHPFEKWTQQQHWQMAALFGDIERQNVKGRRQMAREIDAAAGTTAPTIEEIIGDKGPASSERVPQVKDPNGRTWGPEFPFAHAGFDSGGVAAGGEGPQPGAQRTHRERLADWLTAPENPLFAKSYVNRIWSYLMGRGLIDPVDDIRAGNPPSHPELLKRLTQEFVDSGFDTRALIRSICTTRAYQRSVRPNEWNADDEVHYARALPRRLPAEVLFDVVHQATGSRPHIGGTRPGTRARDLVDPTVKASDGFLDLFGRPERGSVCECEREDGLSLGQALSLVNGPTIGDAIRDPDNAIAELAAYEKNPARIARELYLRFLGREPSSGEMSQIVPAIEPKRRETIDALPPDQRAEYDAAISKWEADLNFPDWQPAQIGTVRSMNGTPFERLPDGSVVATGDAADKDVYTVGVWTDVWPITGLRLDVLPHDSLDNKGPGRAKGGNFVLSEIKADLVALGDVTKSQPLPLKSATADFAQKGYEPAKALTPDNDGWAVHPETGKPHVLVLETGAELDGLFGAGEDLSKATVQGHLIVLRMTFPYGGNHVLGRFRVSVTNAARPVRHRALPEDVVAALKTPAAERTDAHRESLHSHYLGVAPVWADRIRLATTQDLAWSLVNSPAFLFNR